MCKWKTLYYVSAYSCFYIVIKLLLFCFSMYMNVDNRTRLLSNVKSSFIMKDIYGEQFLVLINPVLDYYLFMS